MLSKRLCLWWVSLLLGLILVMLGAPQPGQALGVNSSGSASLIAGSLVPGGSVRIRFEMTPVADSAEQNDFAAGFYVLPPAGWNIITISDAPAPTSAGVCGARSVSQSFCSLPDAADAWALAYWGAQAETANVCHYQLPAGDECGPYTAPLTPGDALAFEVTLSIPFDHPTCPDGTVYLPTDPQDALSFTGVLVSDGYAGPGAGAWSTKNFTITFANECAPEWSGRLNPTSQRPTPTAPTLEDAYLAEPGPYAVGFTTLTVPRVLATAPNSEDFPAYFHYPAVSAGQDTPLDPSGGPYPAIVFGHGFRQNARLYASLGRHLASWGYLVIAPNTANGWFPNQERFVNELRDSLTYLDVAQTDPASFLFGQVDTAHYGAMGHSMGGAATLSATLADERIRAWVPLAPAASLNTPTPMSAAVLLISGAGDSVTPTDFTAAPIYQQLQARRQLVEVAGADHCSWQDRVWPFDAAAWCGEHTLSREESRAISRRLVTAFFNLYLQGEERAHWRAVWGPEKSADPLFSTIALDGGSQVAPAGPASASGAPGTVLTYTVAVTNTQTTSDTFTVWASGNRWGTTVTPDSLVLEPGASGEVTVAVTWPAGALAKEVRYDTVILSVRQSDGLSRGATTLTSELTP